MKNEFTVLIEERKDVFKWEYDGTLSWIERDNVVLNNIRKALTNKTHVAILNAIWKLESKPMILYNDGIYIGFDEIRDEMGDKSLSDDEITELIREMMATYMFSHKEVGYLSLFSLISGYDTIDEAVLVRFNKKNLVSLIVRNEIISKRANELNLIESEDIQKVLVNIETERIVSKLTNKPRSSIKVNIRKIFDETKDLTDESVDYVLSTLEEIGGKKYLNSWKITEDGEVALEIKKRFDYDMKAILEFEWK
jgi:hypothetical protein